MNYHQKIELKKIENISYYEWIDGTGTRHYFKQDSENGKWMDELNNELELTIETVAAEKYVISSKKDHKLRPSNPLPELDVTMRTHAAPGPCGTRFPLNVSASFARCPFCL